MMDAATVSYLAGVIDSLGRIRVRQVGETKLAVVAISSPNRALLSHVAQLTGVRVVSVTRDYARLGCTTHCEKPHLHVVSATARWELVGARAVVVLRAILPHLVLLAPEAVAVLDLCGDAPAKPATLTKMRELGWTL
jgi:ribosomal protein L30E